MASNMFDGKITGTNWLIVPQDVTRKYFNEFFSEKYISFEELQNRAAKDSIIPISCLNDKYLNKVYDMIINEGEITEGVLEGEDISIKYGCEYHIYKDGLENQEIPVGVFAGSYSFIEFIPQLLEDGSGKFEMPFEGEELVFNFEDLDVDIVNYQLYENGDMEGTLTFGYDNASGIFGDSIGFVYNKENDTIDFADDYSYTSEEHYDNCCDEIRDYLANELGLAKDEIQYDDEER